jgi:hypothetical protein
MTRSALTGLALLGPFWRSAPVKPPKAPAATSRKPAKPSAAPHRTCRTASDFSEVQDNRTVRPERLGGFLLPRRGRVKPQRVSVWRFFFGGVRSALPRLPKANLRCVGVISSDQRENHKGQRPALGGCEAPSRGEGRALPGLSAGRGIGNSRHEKRGRGPVLLAFDRGAFPPQNSTRRARNWLCQPLSPARPRKWPAGLRPFAPETLPRSVSWTVLSCPF